MNTQEQNIAEKKLINLTIFSPVNVSVYYNTKSTLLMSIDLNTGINNDTKEIMSEDNFKLIFVTHGFEKTLLQSQLISKLDTNSIWQIC